MTTFLYDLIRTTRRGRTAALRTAYAVVLLVALGGAFVARFPGSLAPDRFFAPIAADHGIAAAFAVDFVSICLLVQFAAAVVLTPVYAAGAIAEERQNGTLDSILVTDLSACEIVFGRFAARWLIVASVLITGVPVMAATQLWGGVSWQFLVLGTSITLLTTLSFAGIGVFCSVRARSARAAVAGSYIFAVALEGFAAIFIIPFFDRASPWYVSGRLGFDNMTGAARATWPIVLAGIAIWHVALCLASLVSAVWLLRPHGVSKVERDLLRRAYERLPKRSRVRAALAPQLLVGAPAPFSSTERTARIPANFVRVPPIGADPLVWKELHFHGTPAGDLLRLIAYAVIGVVLTVALGRVTATMGLRRDPSTTGRRDVVNPVAGDLTTALLTTMMIGTALQAAAAIGRERERRTLDPLLALPGGRDAVLRAKWLGSVVKNRLMTCLLAVLWTLSLLGGMLPIAAAFWLALAAAIHGAFLASLGIFISTVTFGAGRAMVYALFGLAAAWALPLIISAYWIGLFPDLAGEWPWVTALLRDGLTPPTTWRFLAAAAADPPPSWVTNDRVAGAFCGLGIYAAAAWVLWRMAVASFRRTG
jgi:ABC-type transport system involved in multi-copper enzyme maturation permease subunit